VKLSDFGIAKALRRTGDETLTRTRGKPSSMSPEQWQGEKIGSRSDLFSLGLVLWRALIGTHPYAEGRPPTEVFEVWLQDRTVANERRPVIDAAPNAPPSLQRAIHSLLQLAPARMGTAEELVEVLTPLVQSDAATQLGLRVQAPRR
jgi:serine/threonine-protein kinase